MGKWFVPPSSYYKGDYGNNKKKVYYKDNNLATQLGKERAINAHVKQEQAEREYWDYLKNLEDISILTNAAEQSFQNDLAQKPSISVYHTPRIKSMFTALDNIYNYMGLKQQNIDELISNIVPPFEYFLLQKNQEIFTEAAYYVQLKIGGYLNLKQWQYDHIQDKRFQEESVLKIGHDIWEINQNPNLITNNKIIHDINYCFDNSPSFNPNRIITETSYKLTKWQLDHLSKENMHVPRIQAQDKKFREMSYISEAVDYPLKENADDVAKWYHYEKRAKFEELKNSLF